MIEKYDKNKDHENHKEVDFERFRGTEIPLHLLVICLHAVVTRVSSGIIFKPSVFPTDRKNTLIRALTPAFVGSYFITIGNKTQTRTFHKPGKTFRI